MPINSKYIITVASLLYPVEVTEGGVSTYVPIINAGYTTYQPDPDDKIISLFSGDFCFTHAPDILEGTFKYHAPTVYYYIEYGPILEDVVIYTPNILDGKLQAAIIVWGDDASIYSPTVSVGVLDYNVILLDMSVITDPYGIVKLYTPDVLSGVIRAKYVSPYLSDDFTGEITVTDISVEEIELKRAYSNLSLGEENLQCQQSITGIESEFYDLDFEESIQLTHLSASFVLSVRNDLGEIIPCEPIPDPNEVVLIYKNSKVCSFDYAPPLDDPLPRYEQLDDIKTFVVQVDEPQKIFGALVYGEP